MSRRSLTIWRSRILVVLVALLAWTTWPVFAVADVKRVMVLHSFGHDFKPWSEYSKSIRTELQRQAPWPIDIVEYSLVAARLGGGADVERTFAEYLSALFAKNPLDLIISIGAPAAGFVQRHRPQLFTDTPMVLTAIDQRRIQFSNLTVNDVAVAVRINYLAAFENIVRVLPHTENVMGVVGTSPIEKFWKQAITEEVQPLAHRIKLSWTDHLSFDQVLREASRLPPRTAIFWELMIVDAAGVVHEGNTAIARLHAVANAPLFSYDESFFGEGMVGGPFLHVIDTSRKTAEVAVRILGGERAGDIKVVPVEFAAPMFDWRQLQRWNIREAQLPPGSEIRFRHLTAWDQYQWQIVAIVFAILLQAALIHWLLYERRMRHRSEAVARSTMSELTHMNRIATGSELSASIAHEVMQPLTGIVARANAGLRWLAAATPDVDRARAMLTEIVTAGHRAADIVRAIRATFKKDVQNKQPTQLNSLVMEIIPLVSRDLDDHEIILETDLEQGLPAVVGDRTQLQQVLLNLIVNAVDAMKATPLRPRTLRIRSETCKPGVCISIEDSGSGVAADALEDIFKPLFTTKKDGMGLGLSICRSIIEAHHGRIWASRREPRGLIVQFELPLDGSGG